MEKEKEERDRFFQQLNDKTTEWNNLLIDISTVEEKRNNAINQILDNLLEQQIEFDDDKTDKLAKPYIIKKRLNQDR